MTLIRQLPDQAKNSLQKQSGAGQEENDSMRSGRRNPRPTTKCPANARYKEARNGQPYADDGKSDVGSSVGHGT